MSQYQVKFYYLATGMEGRADQCDLGIIEAESKEQAVDKALATHYAGSEKDWGFIRGCLSATIRH